MKTKINYMVLAELVCAFAIFLMLMTAFVMSFQLTFKIKNKLIRENIAILILDNTLERLNSHVKPTEKLIKQIFDDEYENSSIVKNKKIFKKCEIRNKNIMLFFINKKNKEIAKLSIKLK